MKMSPVPKHMNVSYRLCDEMSCKTIAFHVTGEGSLTHKKEYHLCESHYMRYKAELRDESKSNLK